MAAPFLDDHVVAQVLSALAPAALELSVTAAGQVEARRAEVDRIWRQRLERVGYQADRARRQYQLAEPENRLVPFVKRDDDLECRNPGPEAH